MTAFFVHDPDVFDARLLADLRDHLVTSSRRDCHIACRVTASDGVRQPQRARPWLSKNSGSLGPGRQIGMETAVSDTARSSRGSRSRSARPVAKAWGTRSFIVSGEHDNSSRPAKGRLVRHATSHYPPRPTH